MLLERLLHLLLDAKLHLVAAAKIPAVATLLVLGSTGFVVTGTIDGQVVDLTVKPLESKACFDALIAQTETLLELEVLSSDASRQLRHLRDRARESAEEQNKAIDEAALRAQFASSAALLRDALSAARTQVLETEGLSTCQDGDPSTGVALDLADLRARYDRIVRDFIKKANGVLDDAQRAFDVLVRNAQPKPRLAGSSSHSDSSD
jgi:hypothetical protein